MFPLNFKVDQTDLLNRSEPGQHCCVQSRRQLMGLNGQNFFFGSFCVGLLKKSNPCPNHRAEAIKIISHAADSAPKDGQSWL